MRFNNIDEVVDYYQVQIKKIDLSIDYLRKKTKILEKNLENNKIFLNMVVHDMRNPINQIEYLLKQSLESLS